MDRQRPARDARDVGDAAEITVSRTTGRARATGCVATIVLIAVTAAATAPRPLAAADVRFDPDRHLPVESMLHLHVPSGRKLAGALGDTLPGRIARDEEVQAALGEAPARVRQLVRASLAPLVAALGRDPFEILELLDGEIVFSITGLDPLSYVSVVVAVELGPRREAILDLVERTARLAGSVTGREVRRIDIAGRTATVIPLRGPPVYTFVLGDHLIAGLSRDVLARICAAADRDAAGRGDEPGRDLALRDNEALQKAMAATAVADPRLRFAVNLGALRSLAMSATFGSPAGQQIFQVLSVTGLASFGWLGYTLGARDGDIEGKLYLQSTGSQRGALGVILDGFTAPGSIREAFGHVPAAATALGAEAVSAGSILGGLLDLAERRLPQEMWEEVRGFFGRFEDRTGIGLADLRGLGRIEMLSFSVPPPGGGLLDDGLVLVRTAELEPYLEICDRLGRALGRQPREIDAGGRVIHSIRGGGILSATTSLAAQLGVTGGPGVLPVDLGFSLAAARVDDTWSVCALSPRVIERYLRVPQEQLGLPPEAPLARELLAGKDRRIACAFQPSTLLLWLYNTALALAPARLELPSLGAIDLTLLPPAEKFLPALGPGAIAIGWDGDGILLEGRRVVSSAAGAILLGTGAVAAGAVFGTSGSTARRRIPASPRPPQGRRRR